MSPYELKQARLLRHKRAGIRRAEAFRTGWREAMAKAEADARATIEKQRRKNAIIANKARDQARLDRNLAEAEARARPRPEPVVKIVHVPRGVHMPVAGALAVGAIAGFVLCIVLAKIYVYVHGVAS